MKILLQSVLNRLYFRRPGVWTADPNVAHDFEESQAVFDFVDQQNLHENRQEEAALPAARSAAGRKVGRNDPCPCGSGRKYKRCHGVAA